MIVPYIKHYDDKIATCHVMIIQAQNKFIEGTYNISSQYHNETTLRWLHSEMKFYERRLNRLNRIRGVLLILDAIVMCLLFLAGVYLFAAMRITNGT